MFLLANSNYIADFAVVLAAFITGILSPIAMHWARSYFRPKKSYELDDHLIQDDMILKRLSIIREENKFDRIWIGQFHNGEHFYPNGRSVQKISLTYESCKPGVSSLLKIIKGLPVSVFSSFLKILIQDKIYIVHNVDDARDVNVKTLSSFLIELGVKSYYAFAIVDIDNRFIGLLCVDAVLYKKRLTEDQIEFLKSEAKTLAGYIA